MIDARKDLYKFLIFISVLIGIVTTFEFRLLEALSDNLCQTSDPFSEANSIRGSEYLLEKGFFHTYGLADIAYGNKFPDNGVKKNPARPSIYTHYPPGPEWLGYLNFKLLGHGSIHKLRYTPMLLSLVALSIFGYLIFLVEGLYVSVVMTTLVCLVPTYWKMVLALHYHGNALSLLLIMFALLAYAVKDGKYGWGVRSLLLVLGFMQGWLSFDYFFLVALLPIPFLLLYSNEPFIALIRKKTVGFTLLAPGLGFIFAHVMHFLQNILYFGGVNGAFADMFKAAQKSINETLSSGIPFSRLKVIDQYLFDLPYRNYFFGNYLILVLLVFSLCIIATVIGNKIFLQQNKIKIKKEVVAVAASFVISNAWIITMIQHAGEHQHFVPRHYYVFYLIVILTSCLTVKRIYSIRQL
ncbi:MAG: hypothetical protein FD174_2531 [Geobacteraceae bacterium]|nr:MAG: hypothetical protein FD174_2531 [Geobacteraceae bacterium]